MQSQLHQSTAGFMAGWSAMTLNLPVHTSPFRVEPIPMLTGSGLGLVIVLIAIIVAAGL
jgi:hypothetical protein